MINIPWLPIAIAAQFILGSAAVFDKLLLKKRSIEAGPYTFWFGISGIFSIFLLPFGFQWTPAHAIATGLIAGVFFVLAILFEFWVLERIEASETLPLIGSLSPVFTLVFSWYILGTRLGIFDIIGFIFLIITGYLLFFAERREISWKILSFIILSSIFLAASYIGTKLVFNESNFIMGFFWVKMGGVLAVLAMLFSKKLRRGILRSEHTAARNKVLYLANRLYASLGSILVSAAIFLSEPALVDATQNIRYIVIFLFAWLLLRERFRGRLLAFKLVAVVLISIGLGWLALGEYARVLPPVNPDRPIVWGTTFSKYFADEMGLDWRATYEAIITDLKPQKIRLIANWNAIEPQQNIYNFSDLDWQVGEAAKNHISVILVVGEKAPRWPECYIPDWASSMSSEEKNLELNSYIREVILRYRDSPAIEMWQVENEPFLNFGECVRRTTAEMQSEIAVVKAIDSRPVLVTDGGEMGLWKPAANLGDVFGTTMYRRVYPKIIGPIFGLIDYPITPNYFRLKEKVIRQLTNKPDQSYIVIELQAEPWSPKYLNITPIGWQLKNFSPQYFSETLDFAKATGFETYYLWGAEWWYWMKTTQGHSEYWDIARLVMMGQVK